MNTYKILPKIELHDHLDGGLRPQTLIELLKGRGIELPFHDEDSLKKYLSQARKGSLERYLSVFGYTVPALKAYKNLVRVAREAVEDWASDGIVYGEIRMAPELLEPELTLEEGLEAMLEGLAAGESQTGTIARLIVCAMRNGPNGERVARAATRYAHKGVVGFDIAGKEFGFPAGPFAEAYRIAGEAGLGLTVHAGEADGPESVRQAVRLCHATRLGHGVRMREAWSINKQGAVQLDELSQEVLQRGLGIEVCLSSNVQTGAVESLANHPSSDYLKQGFRLNLNTDNRLVSTCTLSGECQMAVEHLGWTPKDLVQTMKNAQIMAFDQQAFDSGLGATLDKAWSDWLVSQ